MTTPASPRPRRPTAIPPLPLWGAACFFASGAAGLLYEVVWSKQLAYLLGSSLHAVATVVAAFLGGLALGARVLGVPLARRGNGGRMYAVLEIGVGLLGLLSLPALRGLDPLVGQLYRSLGGESPAFALVRFGLLFALLLPPTALMGATLPVLVAHFEHRWVGPTLARLYALNTFGAVVGSLAGGFALMPGLGLTGTLWVAATLNLAVAALAWSASRAKPHAAPSPARGPGERDASDERGWSVATGSPTSQEHAQPAQGKAGASDGAPARRRHPAHPGRAGASPQHARKRDKAPIELTGADRMAFALMFALSGLAALAFQIAWVRLFALAIGSSVYSLSAVLGVYLFGLALGSAAVMRRMAGRVTPALFAGLQLALAVVAGLVLHAFPRIPQWVFDLGERAGSRWGTLFAGEVGLVAWLILVPCALLGAVFPVAARLLQRDDGGHAAGFAYAVNTLGTIAGSLLAGFFMVPTWGVQGTHLAALVLSLAIGLVALLLARRHGGVSGAGMVWAGVAIVAGAGLAVTAPRWDPTLQSTGLYRPTQALELKRVAQGADPGSLVYQASRLLRILYYKEGVNGSVMVGTDPEGGERWLRVGGKVDASTLDMETQVLCGLLPAALADSGVRTLVIGHGSGMTTAAVLAAGAGATDVVELEPEVIEASRFFHGAGEDPLDDPRTRVVLGDARTLVGHGSGRYGLIVSQPSNPWIAGVNNLFTVDFYRRVRSRLEPDGVFCQWFQVYEIAPPTFSSLIASFLEVFPEGHAFVVWRNSDVLLIAAPEARRLALERLSGPVAGRMLERTRIRSSGDLAGYYAGRLADLVPAARGAVLNRDDRPIVEYRAARELTTVGRAALRGDPKVTAMLPFAEGRPAGGLAASWTTEGWYDARARRLSDLGLNDRAQRVARAARSAGLTALANRLDGDIEAGRRRQRGQEAMEHAIALLQAGREAEGMAELVRATDTDPSNGHAWLLLADRRRLAGDTTGAEAALARGRASDDPAIRAEAAGVTGMMELQRRPAVAAEWFRRAQALNPRASQNYVLEARALAAAGDRAGAKAAVTRGLAALPGDPRLSAMLAELGP